MGRGQRGGEKERKEERSGSRGRKEGGRELKSFPPLRAEDGSGGTWRIGRSSVPLHPNPVTLHLRQLERSPADGAGHGEGAQDRSAADEDVVNHMIQQLVLLLQRQHARAPGPAVERTLRGRMHLDHPPEDRMQRPGSHPRGTLGRALACVQHLLHPLLLPVSLQLPQQLDAVG
eukprot:765523-Hanusia_phi.AAC.1